VLWVWCSAEDEVFVKVGVIVKVLMAVLTESAEVIVTISPDCF
jgi:hypothetical protein